MFWPGAIRDRSQLLSDYSEITILYEPNQNYRSRATTNTSIRRCRCPYALAMSFRINAKNIFLTYPQSTTVPHGYLHQTLCDLPREKNVFSCREVHSEGGEHHHALLTYTDKFNLRNERYYDIEYAGRIFHPKIEAARDVGDCNRYIAKDGNTLGDPVATTSERRKNVYHDLLADATSAAHFMQLAEERDAKNFVLHNDRLESFAAKRWGKWAEAEEPEFRNDSFANVPQAMKDWVTTELNGGASRPKCLIVVGGPDLGKTSWAESLGRHHHWRNKFTAERVKDAKYAILDDFDTLNDHRDEFKGVWGSQRRIGVKVANGVSGHRQWDWGIPSIWLFNQLPSCLWNENNYERQRSILVEVVNKLY